MGDVEQFLHHRGRVMAVRNLGQDAQRDVIVDYCLANVQYVDAKLREHAVDGGNQTRPDRGRSR